MSTPDPRRPRSRAGAHLRPGLGRLVAVELRNMVNTRAGFWLQVATVAITVVAVVVRLRCRRGGGPHLPPSSRSGCCRPPSRCRSSVSGSSPRSRPSGPA